MTALHEIPPVQHALPALVATVPVLRSARLVLRAPMLADFDTLLAIDESVATTSRRGPRARAESWEDFMQMTAVWLLRGHGWWTVTLQDAAIGFVGLGFEPGDQEPELGYLLTAEARGKGYATEACHAVRACAKDTLGLPSLVSYISDTNAASQNVARKLGAVRDAASEAALQAAGETGVQVWRHWGGTA